MTVCLFSMLPATEESTSSDEDLAVQLKAPEKACTARELESRLFKNKNEL